MDLKQDIRSKLSPENYDILCETLKNFKDKGGSRDDAYRVLGELRAEKPPEDIDDLILELMDVVSGFCSVHNRIWEEPET